MQAFINWLALIFAALTLGLVAFYPRPGIDPDTQTPLLMPGANGKATLGPVSAERRSAEMASRLASAHPLEGIGLNHIFGETLETEESTPSLGDFPALFRPRALRANIQEGGIRLSWLPHSRNPIQGLEYRLERWNSSGGLDATFMVEGTEVLDRLDCEGITFHYRVYAELERESPGVSGGHTLRRSSPAAKTKIALQSKSTWIADALHDNLTLVLRLRRPDRPELGPFEAIPGEKIGESGWILESFTKGETEVATMTRIPRFDALGRRIIVDGRPANRGREGTEMRTFVTAHLLDPCGTPWRQNLLLPPPSPRHNGAPPLLDSRQ
jgi:hypothetical protein